MCICFVVINDDPAVFPYRVCLAANRDEYFSRPTSRLQRWKEPDFDIIGGRDIQAGGTWLAINSDTGKIGVLLNMRDRESSAIVRDPKLSRGSLIPEYLKSPQDAKSFAEELHPKSDQYDPFTLLMLEPCGKNSGGYQGHYFGSVTKQHKHFTSARNGESFGFSNTHPDQPYLKVKEGLRRFDDVLRRIVSKPAAEEGSLLQEELTSALLSLLSSTDQHFPDDVMVQAFPNGFPEQHLTRLSAINVQANEIAYGTRVQTLVFVDFDNNVRVTEKDVVPVSYRNLQTGDTTQTAEDLISIQFQLGRNVL